MDPLEPCLPRRLEAGGHLAPGRYRQIVHEKVRVKHKKAIGDRRVEPGEPPER